MDRDLLDAARIGVEHLDLEAAGPGTSSPRTGSAADLRHQIAAERIDLLAPPRRRRIRRRRPRSTSSRLARASATNEPSGWRDHAGRLVLVVLVGDIADDLLDDVLDRDEAVGAAVFVDHQREMDARGLHLGEQVDRRHRRRHEQDLAHDLGRRQRHREIDRLEIEAGRQRLLALRRCLSRLDRGARRS